MQARICSLVLPIRTVLVCNAMLARWPTQELTASPNSDKTSRRGFFGISGFPLT
jgi:hypothetical protein